MNKEEIKKAIKIIFNEVCEKCYFPRKRSCESCLKENRKKIRKYIKELEQKESILDKVTEYIENYIDDKQNEYEAISESYICQTDEDEYIKEKKLSIIKGQKQVLKNVLNIIEGEKK